MKPRIGISACLLGRAVRYDGTHRLDWPVVTIFERHCEFIPICPESDCGMGVPRETMRLEGNLSFPRLVTTTSRIDKTSQLEEWARERIAKLREENPAGFIFKSGSPSCGLAVAIYDYRSGAVRSGTGLFSRRFVDAFPGLPVAEAAGRHDGAARRDFIARVLETQKTQK